MEQANIQPSILNPIRIIQEIDGSSRRWDVRGFTFDRPRLEHLVDLIVRRDDTHQEVTEIVFYYFHLLRPPDGGLNVLRDLFANNTTLTKIELYHCNFGSQEGASQLIAAFETNRTVVDLTIEDTIHLEGVALGNSISGLLHMSQLQRLTVQGELNVDFARSLQPGLRAISRNLKILDLSRCYMVDNDDVDEVLHLIVDALVGNTTMEEFHFRGNGFDEWPQKITSNYLADISRLVEFTQLKKICKVGDHLFTNNKDAVKNFMSVLQQHTSLEQFIGLDFPRFPQHKARINNILKRNQRIRRAMSLLALQPRTGMPIAAKSGIWYKAIANFAKQGLDHQIQSDEACSVDSSHEYEVQTDEEEDDNDDDDDDDDAGAGDSVHSDDLVATYPGASAIFMILHTRHAILEKQLKRPATGAPPPESSTGPRRAAVEQGNLLRQSQKVDKKKHRRL